MSSFNSQASPTTQLQPITTTIRHPHHEPPQHLQSMRLPRRPLLPSIPHLTRHYRLYRPPLLRLLTTSSPLHLPGRGTVQRGFIPRKDRGRINNPPPQTGKPVTSKYSFNQEPQSAGEEYEITQDPNNPEVFRTNNAPKFSAEIKEWGLLGNVITEMPTGKRGEGEDTGVYVNLSKPSTTLVCGRDERERDGSVSCLLENLLLGGKSDVNKVESKRSALVFHYAVPPDAEDREPPYDVVRNLKPCALANLSLPATDGNAHVENLRILLSPITFKELYPLYRGKYPNATILPLKISMKLLDDVDVFCLLSAFPFGFQKKWYDKNNPGSFNRFYFKGLFDFDGLLHLANRALPDDEFTAVAQRMKFLRSVIKVNPEDALFKNRDIFKSQYCDDRYEKFGKKKLNAVVGENEELLSGEDGGMVIVDLTCKTVDDVSASVLFNLVLKEYRRINEKEEKKWALVLNSAENYILTTPLHRRFTDHITSLSLSQHANATRSFLPSASTDSTPPTPPQIIISAKHPLDTPRLSRLITTRILHSANKRHMKYFVKTTDAVRRMYYGLLTPNDVQMRHEDFNPAYATRSDDYEREVIVQSMSLRTKKTEEKIAKEKERHSRLLEDRTFSYKELGFLARKRLRQALDSYAALLKREGDGYEWHSQSVKVLVRDPVTVREPGSSFEEEEGKKQKNAPKLKEKKKKKMMAAREAALEARKERRENHERKRLRNLERAERKAREDEEMRKEESKVAAAVMELTGEKNAMRTADRVHRKMEEKKRKAEAEERWRGEVFGDVTSTSIPQ